MNAIQDCGVLVLVFSAAANASRQLGRELKLADDAKKTVLPVRIENVLPSGNFAYFLGAAHWLDAIGGIREEHLQRLTMGLRKRLGSAGEVRVNAEEVTAVGELSVLPGSESAVFPAGHETEHNEPVRPTAEVERPTGIRWTGNSARYAYVAVTLVAVGVIAWQMRDPAPHTPSGGTPTETPGPQAADAAAKPSTDSKIRTRVNPADGLTYVFIPPGAFMMGCSPGDTDCDSDEKPPHAEQIANGFWLGQTEVTQAAWAKVKGGNPSNFKGDQLPVENVDWAQAGDYCKAVGGRLPTEKEWEYAARAGTTGPRYDAVDAIAWYYGNSGGTTHPVGLKQANAFGLYDMLGNVWEWMTDDYEPGKKVVRGGAWAVVPRYVRVSIRVWGELGFRRGDGGFRCVGEFR